MNENGPFPEVVGLTAKENETVLVEQIKYLLHEARKINEGQNGIILEVDGFLQESVVERESVAKVLKVYNREYFGSGAAEYEKQKKAKAILDENRQNFKGELAYIPTPLLYQDILLDDNLSDRIRNLGAHITDRSEILFMDDVPGKDLATILYAELLKRHPSAKHLQGEDIESWSISDLQEEVSRLFFARAKNASGSLEERAQANERVFRANAETLIQELASIGFRVDPRIIAILENSLKCLRQNGMAMLDAHERNFMVQGDIENLCDGKVYLVDFGDADYKGRPVVDDDFSGRRLDMAVPLFLKKLNHLCDEKRERDKKLQWFERDPKISAVFNRVRSKKIAFEAGTASPFGFSKSKTRTQGRDSKVVLFEQALNTAIEQYRETSLFDTKTILKVLSAHGIRPASDPLEQNVIWNANAFLEGFLYKIVEAYQKDMIQDKDVLKILESLVQASVFQKIFEDTKYHQYWNKEYFTKQLPEVLIQIGEQEKSPESTAVIEGKG